MSDSAAQPMILVKKPDGTFVRVPLSDIPKKSAAAPQSVAPAPATTAAHHAGHTHHAAAHASAVHHTAHGGRHKHHFPPPPADRYGVWGKAEPKQPGQAPSQPVAPPKPQSPTQSPAPATPAPEPAGKPTEQHFPHANRRKMHIPELENAAPKPVKPAEAKPAHKFAHEDVISLLEEQAPAIDAALPAISQNRSGQVDEVIRTLPFKVPDDLANRLRTIIQLFLKDVRSSEQTREVLTRATADGGFGLTKNQANAVIVSAEEVNGRLVSSDAPAVAPIKKPMVAATTITKPSISSSMADRSAMNGKGEMVRRATEATRIDAPTAPPRFNMHETPTGKTVMHDVVVPMRPTTMGPVDEIRYLSTEEYRRFGTTPEQAVGRVKQKFLTLKEESVLLFLQAIDAWRQCPLYLEYVSAVARSLNEKQKMSALQFDKGALQWADMKVIIEMEQALFF